MILFMHINIFLLESGLLCTLLAGHKIEKLEPVRCEFHMTHCVA